jgi:hypothetical protein
MRANRFFIRLIPGGFLLPKNTILGADHVIDYKKEDRSTI